MEIKKTHPYIYTLKFIPSIELLQFQENYRNFLHDELLNAVSEKNFEKIYEICLSMQCLNDDQEEWSKFKNTNKFDQGETKIV